MFLFLRMRRIKSKLDRAGNKVGMGDEQRVSQSVSCALKMSLWFGLQKEKHTFPIVWKRKGKLVSCQEVKRFFAYSCSFIWGRVTRSSGRNTWEVLKQYFRVLRCLQLFRN